MKRRAYAITANDENAVTEDFKENVVQLPTPKTPRHRDALSKRVPITPRHRVGLIGKPLTPRTPRTPSTPSNTQTAYNCARQLFTRSAAPGPLIGREDERKELEKFIEAGIASKAGRCMYVSGPPGTGKSALVSEVFQTYKSSEGIRTAYVNCMSAKCSNDVYGRLLEELVDNDYEMEQDPIVQLKALFLSTSKAANCTYLVTLDEIDHLLTLDLEILYTLFELSLHRSSRLVVVGIANALDLTDRFLPRLKARNVKPKLLPFLPYTAPQIAAVLTTKLKSLSTTGDAAQSDYIPFLHPAAIQLCSKKVASQSGDLRKAFDIARRAVDLVEMETKQNYQLDLSLQKSPSKRPLGENPNLSSPTCCTPSLAVFLSALTPQTAPRATIAHVSRVSAATLSNGTTQRLQTLNLQQKAVLSALIFHRKTSSKSASSVFPTPSKTTPAPTVRSLYATYCGLCERDKAIHPLTSTEFADVVSGLETLSLIGEEKSGRGFGMVPSTPIKKNKGVVGKEKRVVSFVDEAEVKGCLVGVSGAILTSLLADD